MTAPITTQWIAIQPGFEAYLALPPAGSGPALLLFKEIFGVNSHIRALAEQYALDGFVVLAPDVFWRQAPRIELGYEGDDRQRGVQIAGQLKPDEVQADIQAAAQALRARSEAAGRKLGAIGYCMGGRLAFNAAAIAGVDAAVAYYGGGIHNQLDLAPRITAPVLFHYAEHDDHIPMTAVDRVRDAMGPRGEVHIYPGAHHGFNCWARGSYHAPSAALAHGRSLAFLSQLF